jgi:hypothetical protein
MLELTRTLLDRGASELAMQEVQPLLRRQVRAASAGAVGRLRLMLATRVHLAEGRHEPALTLLADAVEGAQRYGVDAVLAECLEGLSHVHEARGEFADALHCMRASCAAEGRHRHEIAVARSVLLENCGFARREEARLVGQVTELLTNAGVETAEQEASGQQAPEQEAPEPEDAEQEAAETAITAIDAPEPEVAVAEAAERELGDARVARHRRGKAGALLSVSDLLPSSAFSAGRSGRRRAQEAAGEPADEASPVEVHQARDGDSEEGRSSGTVEDGTAGCAPTGGAEPLTETRRELPTSAGPPPAPKPRALQWESDAGPVGNAETPPQLGLGDLLAEALAAYQESREVYQESREVHSHSLAMGTSDEDGSSAADAGTVRDQPRYCGPGARWAAGLALAPNLSGQDVSRPSLGDEDGDPSEEITKPLLRLPELTAEPRWVPPEPGRRSAAGD